VCNTTGIIISLNKTQLDASNRPYRIFFQNQQTVSSCIIHSQNATLVDNTTLAIQSDFNKCGIQTVERDNNSIAYNQTIVIFFEATNSTLQDEQEVQHVQCVVAKSATVPLNSGSVNVTIEENEIIKCEKLQSVAHQRFPVTKKRKLFSLSNTMKLGCST